MNSSARCRRLQELLRVLITGCYMLGVVWADEPRKRLSLDFGWRFLLGDPAAAAAKTFDDSDWRRLDVPHDWSIEGPFLESNNSGKAGGYAPLGTGWYRRSFHLFPTEKGKKVFLNFDGVFEKADVWVNGQKVGHNESGYLGFQCDATPAVNFDATNVVAVRVENSRQANRWYTGSGIYRHVWLETMEPVHVARWGSCVTTPVVTTSSAGVRIRTRLTNESGLDRVFMLKTAIYTDGNTGVMGMAETQTNLPAWTEVDVVQNFVVKNPRLWSPEDPHLYRAVSVAEAMLEGQHEAGTVIDAYHTKFGIRTIKFDAEHGFSINEQKTVLKGVCLHHDNGALGAVSLEGAIERRLEILREMGCNAVRLSHNPHSPEMLDLCDWLGLLVIDEAFDKWSGFKPNGEGWRDNLASFIARDRNHPSVIAWSVGNEVKEQAKPEGIPLAKSMVEFVHGFEPGRPVTCALHPGRVANLALTEMAQTFDLASMNYQTQAYETDHQEHPRMVIVGSETLPFYTYNLRRKSDDDKFIAGNSWFAVKEYVAGQFIWAGVDYLGESPGWPFKGWSLGLVDTCGFRKDFSYYQQSLYSKDPIVRIVVFDPAGGDAAGKKGWGWPAMASHWNWPTSEKTLKVAVFANCATVQLLLNGKSLGQKKLGDFPERILTWQVPNEAGTLRATGWKNGKEVCTHELKTAHEPARIALGLDRDNLWANGQAVSHIAASVVDADGTLVPNADR
ncbi:MAG TPA: glycoside hydrolase family 2 TIM barrel-domain containing protein, partial [Patescibacteria group bacterium]|nr:glycoside hydrolase family 2 TIM barrel-domain containing protein [Patescibacteria group bacterium]